MGEFVRRTSQVRVTSQARAKFQDFFFFLVFFLLCLSASTMTSVRNITNIFFFLSDAIVYFLEVQIELNVWQAVTAKSRSSFKSSSNRLLTLASCKSSMLRLEKVWASLVKRWLSLVWEASVLASEFSVSR